MKTRIVLIVALLGIASINSAQQNQKWEKFNWLLGAWKGEGSGKPGEGEGSFAFSLDLGGEVMIRRGHTDFPATKDTPAATHEDLMVIYLDAASGQAKAVYFDNEGHMISYAIAMVEKSIVLTSEKNGNSPAFRLTYTPLDKETMDTSFDMSQEIGRAHV
jgi:hypothetical protein